VQARVAILSHTPADGSLHRRREACLNRIETRNKPSVRRHTSYGSAMDAPEALDQDHWGRAIIEQFDEERSRDDECMEDEEKVIAGRPDANIPAL
jgi:hypothetical protein